MLVKIVKEFPFAPDGLRTKLVKPGDPDINVPDHLLVGLMTAGFISVEGVGETATVITVDQTDVQALGSDGFDKNTASVDELRAYLTSKGISFHHKAGADKLRSLVQ